MKRRGGDGGCVSSYSEAMAAERIIELRASLPAGEVALIDDTLAWLRVAQRAVEHLAECKGVGAGIALRELRLDPQCILFCPESGVFSSS